MQRLIVGSAAVLALIGLMLLGAIYGRSLLLGTERAVEQQMTTSYHQVWVAAAWPVENALRLLSSQDGALGFPSLTHLGTHSHGNTLGKAPGNSAIGWDDWLRPGVEARWRQLHAHTRQAAQVRGLVTIELWLAPVLVLVLAMKPLLVLTAGLGRLQPGTGHGSARLASRREVRALRPRPRESGLRLGRVGHHTVALREREVYEHVLVCGPPGSGKSSGLIIPNILAERGSRSLVIVDPKSELLGLTYGAVSRHSDVWVVNFLDPDNSHGYNPLALVTNYLTAEAFAECWITNTGRSAKEPFWDNAAKQLIVAAVLHLRAEQPERPPTLTELASFFTRHDAETITAIFGASKSKVAQECATSFLASMRQNEKLLGSVFTELPPRFSIMRDPRVQNTTSRHDVEFARLGHQDGRPIALYLALERTLAPLLKPLSACFFMQLFEELIRIADASPGGILPRPVFGYLDEMGNIGAIPDMARWMSTVRSAKIGFLLAVQDLAQLGATYGKEGRQIIVTDCSTKIALPKTSADDAEWFSRGTGTATVLSYTAGDSRKRGDRLARSGNRSVSEVGRPLLTSGEVTRLAEDTMLVLAGNRQPLLVTQRRWYQDRRLRKLGRLQPEGPVAAPPGTPTTTNQIEQEAGPTAVANTTAAGSPEPAAPPAANEATAAAENDGAVQLDHNVHAGEATWVPAPEDRAPVPQAAAAEAAPETASAADSDEFELP